jgi:hypothetical protein
MLQNKLKQEKYFDRIRSIVFDVIRDQGCRVYLFGSRADKVDVVDLRTTSDAFRENVFRNGVLWEDELETGRL